MLRDRMQVAAPRTGRRQREVHPLGVQPRAQRGLGEFLLPGFERRFQLLLGGVQHLPIRLRSSGESLPMSLLISASAPLRPSASTRTASSSSARVRGSDPRKGTGRQFLYGFVKHVMEISL